MRGLLEIVMICMYRISSGMVAILEVFSEKAIDLCIIIVIRLPLLNTRSS